MIYIIENQLFPSIDYLKMLIEGEYVILDKYENFQKMSFRNRYLIEGANGIQILTIPVKGGREQKTSMAEIRIDRTNNWAAKHGKAIVSAYRKSPWFDYYAADIFDLLQSKEEYLFDFNLQILKWISKVVNFPFEPVITHKYERALPQVADKRNTLLPKNYQNVDVGWQPTYAQVFEDRHGFQPNLSVLDLLFCTGPQAGDLLRGSVK